MLWDQCCGDGRDYSQLTDRAYRGPYPGLDSSPDDLCTGCTHGRARRAASHLGRRITADGELYEHSNGKAMVREGDRLDDCLHSLQARCGTDLCRCVQPHRHGRVQGRWRRYLDDPHRTCPDAHGFDRIASSTQVCGSDDGRCRRRWSRGPGDGRCRWRNRRGPG